MSAAATASDAQPLVLDVPLTGLDTIDLGELTERASLLTRIDRKYLLPRSELDAVLADLTPVCACSTSTGCAPARMSRCTSTPRSSPAF